MKCLSPIQILNKSTQEYIDVPCGRCPSCLIRYRDQWKWRLSKEYQSFGYQGLFFTLTYSDENVPIKDVSGYPIQVLDKSHLKSFLKHVRNKVDYFNRLHQDDIIKYRYFCVGEYGSHTFRPHYHGLIFSDHLDFFRDSLCDWSLGFIEVKDIIPEHLQYVCKYTLKQLVPYCQDMDIPLPFSLMSKGIAFDYLNSQEFIDGHYSFKPFVYDFKGYRIPMPRYVRNHSYTLDEWNSYHDKVSGEVQNSPSIVHQFDDLTSLSFHLQSIIDKAHDLDKI